MKNRKTIIIVIVIVLFLIIVSIATFLIYKNNKKKKELKKQELAQQMLLLQQQQASSNTTPTQKQNLVAQLASLAQQIKDLSEPNEVITQINDQVAPIEVESLFPLKKGSKGQYVSNLQNGLNSKCSANLVPDGAFGNLTQNALVKCFGPTQVDFALYNKIIS